MHRNWKKLAASELANLKLSNFNLSNSTQSRTSYKCSFLVVHRAMAINHGNVKTRNSAFELNSVVMDGLTVMMVQMSAVVLIHVVRN